MRPTALSSSATRSPTSTRVDSVTGQLVWKKMADAHSSAAIRTDCPVAGGRLLEPSCRVLQRARRPGTRGPAARRATATNLPSPEALHGHHSYNRCGMAFRLKRTIRVTSFEEEARTRPALRHWLSRPPEERVSAVEFLRKQIDGTGARLRRVHRVVDCPWG
jgi:hypothetical protein